jgi:hypothetical protein
MDDYQAKSVCELLNDQVFEAEILSPDQLRTIISKSSGVQDIIQHLIYLTPTPGKNHRIYHIIKAFDWEL